MPYEVHEDKIVMRAGKYEWPNAWTKLVRGIRVDEDKVIITARGGNEAARELCNALLKEVGK